MRAVSSLKFTILQQQQCEYYRVNFLCTYLIMASPLRLPTKPRQRLWSVTAACACMQSCATCDVYTALSSQTLVIANAAAATQE
jgi:hypothetical protein